MLEARTAAAAPGADRAAWPAVYALAFGAFGVVAAELLPVSILTPMAVDLDTSLGAVGQSVTMTAVVAAIAGPLLVLGAGRIDRRILIWMLMALLVGSSLISAFAPNLQVLLFGRSLLGVALGGYWALTTALALRLVPAAEVSRAIAIIVMGVSAATVFAVPLAAALGAIVGWRATFLAAAGFGVVSLAIQAAVLPRMPSTGAVGFAAFRLALSRRAILIGLGVSIVVTSGHFAGFTFIRPFLEEVSGLSISAVSAALMAFGLGGLAGNAAAGALATRSPAWAFGSSALLIATAALALVLQGQSAAVGLVATGLWGFAFGGVPVSASVWNARVASDVAESAGALMAAAFQIAIASGAFMGGALIDSIGPSGVLAYAAIAVLVGALTILTVGRAEERRRALNGCPA